MVHAGKTKPGAAILSIQIDNQVLEINLKNRSYPRFSIINRKGIGNTIG